MPGLIIYLVVMDSSRVLEIILQVLGELVEYELPVILKYDGQQGLRVIKALGPLATKALNNYSISLEDRPDLVAQHSCLIFPLMIEAELVGLITLDHRSCNRFSPAIVRFVETLSKLSSESNVFSHLLKDSTE